MQAITIAIGKSGIEYFSRQLVAGKAVAILQGAKPGDKTMSIPNFLVVFFGGSSSYSNFTVSLTDGKLVGFTPAFNQVKQLDSGDPAGSQFDLKLVAGSFSASYGWREKYHVYTCFSGGRVGPICSGSDEDNSFPYGPAFGSLTVDLTLGFEFDAASKSYAISVVSAAAVPANISPNIPGKSALNGQESDGCLKTKVSDATADSLAKIDFKALIDPLFPPLLASIPASGELTENVGFAFDLGGSGLVFPGASGGHDGIQIGVTGVASYKGKAYDATPAPDLPLPAVPVDSDDHHLNVYVSDWAVNGLNWAYFEDGKLKVVVQPSDLPNPDALKVKTYASWIPAFKQYGNAAMTATITPLA
ncbi:MAG: hypothetical protein R3190_09270, partial [Thermoanaerobaculia bacterium]|nr:hypothetical protein [Thermoanaerobaculia bacterium]